MKQKLINKGTIYYLKHGNILYGQPGIKIDKNQFAERYSNLNKLRTEFYRKYGERLPSEYLESQFQQFLKNNYVQNGSYYYRKDTALANDYKIKNRLKQDSNYKEYYRDPETGQLYKKIINMGTGSQPYSSSGYIKITEDIKDPITNKIILKAYENGNFGKYHHDQNVGYGNYRGQKLAVRYNKDTKGWAYNPVDDDDNAWYTAQDDLLKLLNKTYPASIFNQPENTDSDNDEAAAPGDEASNNDAGNGNAGNGNAEDEEGPDPSVFNPNVTDRRELEESIIHKPAVAPQRQNSNYRLIKRTIPVARPSNMPMMNRSDVRYTLKDITTQSPYFTSDVELVNSLAGTPNDNMFKQALMNRLGMDKWDNTTALNRLNFLGIKGHIGGSDRKRLRNLINKGTTSNGEIRK